MSVYPLMLDGTAIRALVVGGGPVAARKVEGLLAAGASVRILATALSPAVRELHPNARLTILPPRAYTADAIEDATFVIAATDDPSVNAAIAADARTRGCLVNVVDDPSAGTCVTPAVHRAEGLVIAVSAGGVPGAAVRVRDAVGARFDHRYAAAVQRLSALRSLFLRRGDEGRARWATAQQALVGDDFCESVESGAFERRAAEWA